MWHGHERHERARVLHTNDVHAHGHRPLCLNSPANPAMPIMQEHRVHKVEMRTKENGDQEEELVVSVSGKQRLPHSAHGGRGGIKGRGGERDGVHCTVHTFQIG